MDFFVRLQTFLNWPYNAPVRPIELARCGFVFGGNGDEVMCSFCGIKMSNWRLGENVTDKHRKHNPCCPFSRADCWASRKSSLNDLYTAKLTLERKATQLEEARKCKVCLDKPVEVVFLNCGHLVTCSVCAPAMKNCPACKRCIQKRIQTYL